MRTRIDFARSQTPPAHGDVLVEPPAASLPALLEHNRALIGRYAFSIGGLSLREARVLLREAAAQGTDQPLVVTGHQPDFIHAGVWAKHVVAMRLAQAVGGRALNLIVDQDAPKRTTLQVPFVSGQRLGVRSIGSTDWARGVPFEFMPAADEKKAQHLERETRAALAQRYERSLLPVFFDSYVAGAGHGEWVDQAAASRRAVDAALGVRVDDRRVSRFWCGPLMSELLAETRRFAAAYNAALALYRRAHGVTGAKRPVPDLQCDADRCELPVWAYRPGGPRRRLFVHQRGSVLELFADEELIGSLDALRVRKWHMLEGQLCSLGEWVLRPRALTLTLWARLLLADIFVHGIGGAKYDRITDELIRKYFGQKPPGSACVSATMQLALPHQPLTAHAVEGARRRLRDLQYNPQRYVEVDGADTHVLAKARAVSESLRLRTEDPHNRAARRSVFRLIRECNKRIGALQPGLRHRLVQELAALERRSVETRIARSREYFFAMHPREELEKLLARLPSVQDFSRSAIV